MSFRARVLVPRASTAGRLAQTTGHPVHFTNMSELKPACKAVERPPANRAILRPWRTRRQRMTRTTYGGQAQTASAFFADRRTIIAPPKSTLAGLTAVLLLLACVGARAAVVTGTLKDIGLASYQTSLTFTPTNRVLITAGGLQVGPPKTITATNGSFSLTLDAGDYWVRCPLVPTRAAFIIAVPSGTSTNNITNLVVNSLSYVFTHQVAVAQGTNVVLTTNDVGLVTISAEAAALNGTVPDAWLSSQATNRYVNLLTYGVSSGGGDDTAAIQAAIDAHTNGAAAVVEFFLPSGTYGLTNSIRIRRDGTRIVGGGGLNTTLTCTGDFPAFVFDPILSANALNGPEIRNLKIVGPGWETSTSAGVYVGHLTDSANQDHIGNMGVLEQLDITGFQYGIAVSNVIGLQVRNCEVQDNLVGILLDHAYFPEVVNCKFGLVSSSSNAIWNATTNIGIRVKRYCQSPIIRGGEFVSLNQAIVLDNGAGSGLGYSVLIEGGKFNSCPGPSIIAITNTPAVILAPAMAAYTNQAPIYINSYPHRVSIFGGLYSMANVLDPVVVSAGDYRWPYYSGVDILVTNTVAENLSAHLPGDALGWANTATASAATNALVQYRDYGSGYPYWAWRFSPTNSASTNGSSYGLTLDYMYGGTRYELAYFDRIHRSVGIAAQPRDGARLTVSGNIDTDGKIFADYVSSTNTLTARSNALVGGNLVVTGAVTATAFSGGGSSLTGIGTNSMSAAAHQLYIGSGDVHSASNNVFAGSNTFATVYADTIEAGTFTADTYAGDFSGASNAVDLVAGPNVSLETNANGRAFTISATHDVSIARTNSPRFYGNFSLSNAIPDSAITWNTATEDGYTFGGDIWAAQFHGSAASLTAIPAAQLTSGTNTATVGAATLVATAGATLIGSVGQTNSMTVNASGVLITNTSTANQGAVFGPNFFASHYGGANSLSQTNGRVGIGTTSPSVLLHLARVGQGEVSRFSENVGTIDVGHENYIAIGYADHARVGQTYGPASKGYLEIGGGRRALTWTSTGNVGIGLTAPLAALHATNSANQAVVFLVDTTEMANSFQVSSNGAVTARYTVAATNGFVLYALDNIPTNSIPASTSANTNWVHLNWTNTGPVYVATNVAAAGSFLLRVPTTTLSTWP